MFRMFTSGLLGSGNDGIHATRRALRPRPRPVGTCVRRSADPAPRGCPPFGGRGAFRGGCSVALVTTCSIPSLRLALASPLADALLAAAPLCLGEAELLAGSTYQGVPVWPGSQEVNALIVVPALTLPLAFRCARPLAAFP